MTGLTLTLPHTNRKNLNKFVVIVAKTIYRDIDLVWTAQSATRENKKLTG